jgi:hypothetical protein
MSCRRVLSSSESTRALRQSKELAQASSTHNRASTSCWKTYDLNLSCIRALIDVARGSYSVVGITCASAQPSLREKLPFASVRMKILKLRKCCIGSGSKSVLAMNSSLTKTIKSRLRDDGS